MRKIIILPILMLLYFVPAVVGAKMGDINGDGSINIADVVYLFKHRDVPLEVGDLNCDNSVDIADVIYLFLNYQKWKEPVVFAKNFQLEPHWDEGYCYAKDASGKWYLIDKKGYTPLLNIKYVEVNQRQFGESSFLGMAEWVKFYSAFRGEKHIRKLMNTSKLYGKREMNL
ncbi:hypothetical protein ACO3VM_02475 [Methanocaldococcus sp. 10A]